MAKGEGDAGSARRTHYEAAASILAGVGRRERGPSPPLFTSVPCSSLTHALTAAAKASAAREEPPSTHASRSKAALAAAEAATIKDDIVAGLVESGSDSDRDTLDGKASGLPAKNPASGLPAEDPVERERRLRRLRGEWKEN
eukprot:4740477-Pleurochrysis_carterae.AAC.1